MLSSLKIHKYHYMQMTPYCFVTYVIKCFEYEKSLTMQSGHAAAESQSSQEDQWFSHHLDSCFDVSAPMRM